MNQYTQKIYEQNIGLIKKIVKSTNPSNKQTDGLPFGDLVNDVFGSNGPSNPQPKAPDNEFDKLMNEMFGVNNASNQTNADFGSVSPFATPLNTNSSEESILPSDFNCESAYKGYLTSQYDLIFESMTNHNDAMEMVDFYNALEADQWKEASKEDVAELLVPYNGKYNDNDFKEISFGEPELESSENQQSFSNDLMPFSVPEPEPDPKPESPVSSQPAWPISPIIDEYETQNSEFPNIFPFGAEEDKPKDNAPSSPELPFAFVDDITLNRDKPAKQSDNVDFSDLLTDVSDEKTETPKTPNPKKKSEPVAESNPVVAPIGHIKEVWGKWQYTPWNTEIEATCEESGKETRIVSRTSNYENVESKIETRNIAPLGHKWVEERVVPPTTLSQGWTEYKCEICGEHKQDNFTEPLTPEEWTPQEDTPWKVIKAPTCTNSGIEERKKVQTSSDGKKQVRSERREVPALGHKFGEWAKTKYPTCTEEGLETRTCLQCGGRQKRKILATGHTLGEWTTTKVATCEKEGEETRVCSKCGYKETKSIPATNHEFGEWVQIKPPTCVEDGTETRTCSKCGKKETRPVAKTGHNYNEIVFAPTEDSEGYTLHKCVNCGDSYKDNIIPKIAKEVWEAWKATSWATTIEPTCEQSGKEERTLTRVSNKGRKEQKKEEREIPSLGHSFGAWQTEKPSCESEGLAVRKCKKCSKTETKTIPISGHSFGQWKTIKPATCTENGEQSRVCANCGKEEKKELPLIGHKFSSWIKTQIPTCTENGTEVRTCQNCGIEETRVVPATGHNFGSWIKTTIPTCTEDGTETRTCKNCGSIETKTVPATGHSYGEWVLTTIPTCTAEGIETKVCSKCGHKETRGVPATGHTFGEWVQTTPPTCTVDGVETKTCTKCGYKETRPIPATDHDYSEWIQTKPATCIEDGVETKTCLKCGNKETRPIPKLGHEYKMTVFAPTEESEGYTLHKCIHCGDSYKENIVPKLEQETWGVWKASKWKTVLAPTCTASGTEERTLTRASNKGRTETKTEQKEVEALGHSFGDWVTTKPACESEGVATRKCKRCSFEETKPLARTGHVFGEWTITKKATCESNGERTRICSQCGKKEQLPIPATGHSFGEWEIARIATCTKEGTMVRICANCGQKEKKAIPADGHDFGDWTLIKIPTCTAAGTEAKICSKCGKKETRPVNKIEHEYQSSVVDPTESAEGYTLHKCVHCGHTYKDNITPKLEKEVWEAWKATAWKVIQAPTQNSTGIEERTLIRVSNKGNKETKKQTRDIPALPKEEVKTKPVEKAPETPKVEETSQDLKSKVMLPKELRTSTASNSTSTSKPEEKKPEEKKAEEKKKETPKKPTDPSDPFADLFEEYKPKEKKPLVSDDDIFSEKGLFRK